MAAVSDATEANKELARRCAEYAWSEQYDELAKFTSEDYVGHDPSVPDGIQGFEGLKEYFSEMHKAMSDTTYEIQDIVAEGDTVFFRGRLTCTHTGEFMGVPATNNHVEVEDHVEMRIEDEKITESWVQYDVLGMMHQLGVEMPGAA